MRSALLGLALSLLLGCVASVPAGQIADDESKSTTAPGETHPEDVCLTSWYESGDIESFQGCLEEATAGISRGRCGDVCHRLEHECNEPTGQRRGCQDVWCACEAVCDVISS